jgi:hypothetical protein
LNPKFAIGLLTVLVCGSANFKAVSQFAQQTANVQDVVRTEFVQLDALCKEQAELDIVVTNVPDDSPLKTCQNYKAAQGRLAVVTLDVLNDYAKAFGGLADNKAFDLTSDIETTVPMRNLLWQQS